MRRSLLNDDTVGFKQTQDFVRMMGVGLENSRLALDDNLLNQRQIVFERSFCSEHLAEGFGPGHQLAILQGQKHSCS